MQGHSFCPELGEWSVGGNMYREIYSCLIRFWLVFGGDGGQKGFISWTRNKIQDLDKIRCLQFPLFAHF